ncbi:MAG: aminomethyltransferase family protein [Sedimentitalea sp.]|uniref:aminomethyltransferase family protein n=2 Tax=Alphaproteobacteria TaxID=28211 RepID=UPI0032673928
MNTPTRVVVADFEEPGWDYGLLKSPYHAAHRANGAHYTVYNARLMPVSQKIDRHDGYRALRTGLIMLDTGERPTEISGPDAEALCNKVFARDISKLKVGRCTYGLLLYPDGGFLCDGVLMRLAEDRFWYVQADGPVISWLIAHSAGLDVKISDPNSWVTQIQGPRALEMLEKICDGGAPQPFGYYGNAEVMVNGVPLILSRTGYTAELGFEFYTPDVNTYDGQAMWNYMLEAGQEFGMEVIGLDSLDARRIEAGIMNNLSDFDESMNPYQAGLGAFIKLDGPDFIGRDALLNLSETAKQPLLSGLRCATGEPLIDGDLMAGDAQIGHVTAASWSPFLSEGVAIIRLTDAALPTKQDIGVRCRDGSLQPARLVSLPMYDEEKRIPRGLEEARPKFSSAA